MKLSDALETMGDVLDETLVSVRYASENDREARILMVRDVKRQFRCSLRVDGVRFLDGAVEHQYILADS